LWSCGDAPDGSSILYSLRPDSLGALVTAKAYTAPGHRPTALAWDGRYLWVTDRDSGRIDRFDPEVEDFTRFVVAPGFSPCGLAWDGSAMWLTDAGTGRLYRLVGGRLSWNGVVDTMSFLHRGEEILLLHDLRNLWYFVPGQQVINRVDFQ
jgi:streptogramin lyase